MMTPAQADQIDRTREVLSPDERDLRRTISALSGVFATLNWIEAGVIDDCVEASDQRNARACLVLAGELLCNELIDRM
jgi:hypothetical protein